MYTGYGKSFSIRLFVLLTLVFLLPSFALAANDLYIKDADMVIATEKDWVCVTKDTKSIDLEGTPFNYTAFYNVVQQTIDLLQSSEYPNVKAVLLYQDAQSNVYEIQVSVTENEQSREIWDFSLLDSNNSTLDEQVVDFYTSANNDIYAATRQEESGMATLTYITCNNGRFSAFSVTSAQTVSLSLHQEAAHDFLDRVQFAKKAPKPVSVSTETQPKKNKSFWDVVGDFFASMWKAIKGGVAHEISIQAESIAIFLFGAAILGIVSLAKFLINVFRKR